MASSSSILGLQRMTLRMQAVDALRRAIAMGELEPGSHVPEIEMAKRLEISRGTLREAMRTLENEGLLVEGARGRVFVRHMGPAELENLFEVRAALEALAARTLARSEDRDAAVVRLRELAGRIAEASGSLEDRMASDMAFHREMCVLTGNDTLVRAWSALEGSILLSITHSGIERAVENMNADRHVEIVDAIASGDPRAAAETVAQHMEHAVRVLTA